MEHTDKIIELICKRGCKSVNAVRTQLENNEPIAELATFSYRDRLVIKEELDSIMSIYENKKIFKIA